MTALTAPSGHIRILIQTRPECSWSSFLQWLLLDENRLLVQCLAVCQLLRVLARLSAYRLCVEPRGGSCLLRLALVKPSTFTKTLLSQDEQSGRTLSSPPTLVSAVDVATTNRLLRTSCWVFYNPFVPIQFRVAVETLEHMFRIKQPTRCIKHPKFILS